MTKYFINCPSKCYRLGNFVEPVSNMKSATAHDATDTTVEGI